MVFSTASVASFCSLFDEMISSEVNDTEYANDGEDHDPHNFISRQSFTDSVGNVSGQRGRLFDCKFAVVPFPAIWTVAAMVPATIGDVKRKCIC